MGHDGVMKHIIKPQAVDEHGVPEDELSFVQMGRVIGRYDRYFADTKHTNPKKFRAYVMLGKGDYVEGWHIYIAACKKLGSMTIDAREYLLENKMLNTFNRVCPESTSLMRTESKSSTSDRLDVMMKSRRVIRRFEKFREEEC